MAPGCALRSEPPASRASRRKRRYCVKDRPQCAGGYWARVQISIKQPSRGNNLFLEAAAAPRASPRPHERGMTSRWSVTPRALIPRVTQPSDSAARVQITGHSLSPCHYERARARDTETRAGSNVLRFFFFLPLKPQQIFIYSLNSRSAWMYFDSLSVAANGFN